MTLSKAVATPVTVRLVTEDGTALRYYDYVPANATVTFAPGQTSVTYTLSINGDRTAEADEWFGVRLSNAVGAAIADDFGKVTIVNDDGLALEAAAAPSRSEAVTELSEQALAPIVDAAITRWAEALAGDAAKLALLESLDVQVAQFDGLTLGLADGTTILIDADAAGWGWYVDADPLDDTEFVTAGGKDDGRMDLLTTVMHEIGHVLGYEHTASDTEDLMNESLDAGERYLPGGQSLVVMDTSELEDDGAQGASAAETPAASSWLHDFLVRKARADHNPFEPLENIRILITDKEAEKV